MSTRSILRYLTAFVAVTFIGACPSLGWGQSDAASRVATFDQDGQLTTFALSVVVNQQIKPVLARDVAILVDTSASQVGEFREDAMTALVSLLEQFDSQDRVQIFAADLDAVPMTTGSVAADSPAIQDAVAQLRNRAPLGSTDFELVLTKAADALSDDGQMAKRILYIGDGVSRARLLDEALFGALIDRLVDEQISVSSLAIGPQCNVEMLAAMANQTGGNVIVDHDHVSAQQAGVSLGLAGKAAVVWPQSVQLPAAMKEHFPAKFPPLRTDRDSILIGTLTDPLQDVQLTMKAGSEGQQIDLQWDLRSEPSNEDFSHLPRLVTLARADQGLTLPTAGSAAMREIRRVLVANSESLTKLGGRALAAGDIQGAEAIADAALANDPSNPGAGVVRDAVQREKDQAAIKLMQFEGNSEESIILGGPVEEGEITIQGEVGPMTETPIFDDLPVEGAFGDAPVEFEEENGKFLDRVEQRRKAREELLQVEVRNAMSTGRRLMDSNPDAAVGEMKLLLDTVRRSTDVSADIRAQLQDQLESAIRMGMRRSFEKSQQDARIAENKAQAASRLSLANSLKRKESRLQQILGQFNALVADGNYLEAEAVAYEAERLDPHNPVATNSIIAAQAGHRMRENLRVADLAERGTWKTLQLVDESRIPFPDDPPLVYPDAETWEELSIRRIKNYGAVDVAKPGAAEKRILEELDKITSIDFVEVPLQEAMLTLKEQLGINIVLDEFALDTASISPEDPVTKTLDGVTLRSALRLMLKDLELTYVVRDEVLKVTTVEEAEEQLVTKVYPVGDLVVPIVNGNIGGGGFGGGFGGGGGGFGGGGFGGGGTFAIPEEPISLNSKSSSSQKLAVPVDTLPDAAANQDQATKVARRSSQIIEKDGNTSWLEFFADQAEKPAEEQVRDTDVRATVAAMTQAKDFQSTIAVLQSALANGFVSPWMYPALGLAMEADGQPPAELERALLSGIDVSNNPDDMIHTAAYLAGIGMEDRALDLLRQVADANPMRPEPQALALKIAKRIGNADAIRWATIGVLKNAWPYDLKAIEEDARRTAKVQLAKMAREGQPDTEDFRKEIADSLARDCTVNVTWTGDADVDILVQEPTGAVCSLGNPRTSGGGTLLGDSSSVSAETDDGSITETYVCPVGYSGDYRLMMRRVWGKVSAGKVNVEITVHDGTDHAQVISRFVELGDEPAVVKFNVPNGRRTERLADHIVQDTIDNQIAIGRSVLSQTLGSGGQGSQTLQGLLYDRALLRRGLAGSRAVGYRPEIENYPEGASMTASAVISPDRRYVRISPQPFFSGIGNVDTFTFVGDPDLGDGGAGGGAGGGGVGGGVGGN